MKLYWLVLIAYGLFSSRFVYADDTEIYRNTQNRVNPNVIFIIDTSGSMAYLPNKNKGPSVNAAATSKTRLDIVKDAANNAISRLDTSLPINIAVMRFDEKYAAGSNSQGAFVLQPFTPTDTSTNKNSLMQSISSLNINNIGGGTPITESIFEAYKYLKGAEAQHGKPTTHSNCASNNTAGCGIGTTYASANNNNTERDISGTYSRRAMTRSGSHENSVTRVGNTSTYNYNSPVEATCQKNHIVLFTDGDPSTDVENNATIKSLVQNMPNSISLPSGYTLNSCTTSTHGSCTVLLAHYLQNSDHFVDSSLTGVTGGTEIKQPMYVHTVGGFSGISDSAKKYLNDIAKFGHPLTSDHLNADGSSKHYYNANDEEALTKALLEVFGGIASTAGNFAAPAVAVNAFNSLEHRDELYYSVFQPSELPGWSGNIKRYRMNSNGEILDVNGNNAVDPNTGFFKDSAKSFWSEEVDGAIVPKGGIANRLSSTRNVYTNIASDKTIIQTTNKIGENNANITKDMLKGLMPANYVFTDADRINALKWARGLDPASNVARKSLADPLHGTPILMTYREGSNIHDVLYAGTNSGFIHAFDPNATDASELWAFMPKELLPNLAVYQTGTSRLLKAYGMDGPMSIYHVDTNRDRIIDANDKAFLTAGMRRGGRNYYLLDISNRNAPKLAATITPNTTGFEELGQTWSRMSTATVMFNGVKTPVYFMGAGYDDKEDEYTTRKAHTMGNAIYMVSADPNNPFKLLWKATGKATNNYGPSMSNMTSSFAGDLTLVDNDGNGTVDLIYAADVGGRIWRFDINPNNRGSSDFANGGVIADFNTGTASGNIRFFTQPDVVYTEYGLIEELDTTTNRSVFKNRGRYQISIGSGFRANPLNTVVKDKIFIINDYDINGAPNAYTRLTLSSLANHATFASGTISQRRNGMYYELPKDGEKVLSTSMTVNNVVYVSTFRPSDANREFGCEPDTGQARLITIEPVKTPTTTERNINFVELKQGGIVPKPVLIFVGGDPDQPVKPIIAIGTETTEIAGDFNAFQRAHWRETN